MINVQNLKYTYPGAVEATIKGICFNIAKGEIYGFLGPSGAGKSTMQKILIRLLNGFRGDVQVLGKELRGWRNNYYFKIGVGFELPNHYPKLTGLENLKLFAALYGGEKKNLMTLLEQVGLKEAANQRTRDYSKGMKMRLNFVRALIHDPEILFFDEPTSGLDPGNARNIKSMILDLQSQGKTIFLTTHNMHDADELCNRVAFISRGEIKAEDSPRALKLKFGKPTVKVEYENSGTKSTSFQMEGLGENKEFMHLLKQNNIVSMHSQEASLDDVFMQTTGEKLFFNGN